MGLSVLSIILITLILQHIDPLSINVDRWSATTCFLDGLSSGIYPYGIHTHVCETNYPSPFPLWHYLNIPFWLLGDVGIGLVFFMLLFTGSIYWFTRSYLQTLFSLFLLIISPAYWWEVMVRSDGLSNAILIFSVILWMERRKISFSHHWLLCAVVCGLLASTRFSAIIPIGLYLMKSFLMTSFRRQFTIVLTVLIIVFIFFVPYIFWDTHSWIFFSRNPFMSQTSTGSIWILLVMAIVAIIGSLRFVTFEQYMRFTSCYLFSFFLLSILYNHIMYHPDISCFTDSDFDISYLSLSLPYCIYSISKNIQPK